MGAVRVEVLVVADCPNEALTVERLRQALDESGRAATTVKIQVVTPETIHEVPVFAGSPTVVIDGVDPFADEATSGAALSCRVYRAADAISGAPSLAALRCAIGR
jgi:hypothetical protein